jgi:hypothetical protein
LITAGNASADIVATYDPDGIQIPTTQPYAREPTTCIV